MCDIALKKNSVISAQVTAVTNLGAGVCRAPDGKVVFVGGAVTGETVKVRIIKVTKGYYVGRLESIETPSPYRDASIVCTAAASCGGCAYRAITYAHELELKRKNVEAEFEKAGLASVHVLPVAYAADENGAPVVWHYRNKAQYRFAQTANGVTVGFYASGTHRVVAGGAECPLQPRIFALIADFVCREATRLGLSVYAEESGKGLLRHLYLRSGSGEDGEILVCFVINGATLPHGEELARAVAQKFPRVVGVVVNVNRKNTNIILGDEYETLWGKDRITDVFCGVRVEIAPAAFYQVNHDAAELLCKKAAELADLSGGEKLLDLYCGIGTVGFSMIHGAAELTGVEIVPEAVACARRNAEANGIKNARFICADSADGVHDALKSEPDVVVVDPPRKGCDEELLRELTGSRTKKLVYISCNPATLARDAALLCAMGWSLSRVQPVDLFPRTGHVETVVLLSHKKPDGHINVKVEFGEGEGKVPLDDIAERAENYKPKERVTYKMIKEYIEAKYGFKVHTAYIAEVKRDLGLPMYDAPNAVEELKNPRKHPTPEKVEAIKDALKHFEVI